MSENSNKRYFSLVNDQLIVLDIDDDKFFVINVDGIQKETNGFSEKTKILLKETLRKNGFPFTALEFDSMVVNQNHRGMGAYSWAKATKVKSGGKFKFSAVFTVLNQTVREFSNLPKIKIKDLSKIQIPKNKSAKNFDIGCINSIFKAISFMEILFPFKFRCLQASYFASKILAKKSVPHKIIIGIQTYNFMSHAWIEYENNVVGDDPEVKSLVRIAEFSIE